MKFDYRTKHLDSGRVLLLTKQRTNLVNVYIVCYQSFIISLSAKEDRYMATTTGKRSRVKCKKPKKRVKSGEHSLAFCFDHINEHRNELSKQLGNY